MNSSDLTTIHREKAVAFVVVRLSSSRLEAKQLKTVGEKPILQWIIDNLRDCRQLDQIVIATVAEEANLPLKKYAEEQEIPCFWYEGEVDHVTNRLRRAAEEYQADICLLISGDCPLIYGPAVDFLVEEFRGAPESEILTILPSQDNQPHALEGVQVARLTAWQKADDLADRPELREHQFPVLWLKPELFSHHQCRLPSYLYAQKHRFSVDTWADLEFMNRLYSRLSAAKQSFQLPNVLSLLTREPELLEINRHVHQRKLIDDNYRTLFVIDAGGKYGAGHLMRSLELARKLTEHKGWSCTFAVDDEDSEAYLKNQGMRTIWSCFARPLRAQRSDSPASIEPLLESFDLLILDIFDQRGPDIGWRKHLASNVSIAVIDNRQAWAQEADIIITPGVTASRQELPANDEAGNRPEHLAGNDYIILRREIVQQQMINTVKSYDLLVYLQDVNQQQQIVDFAKKYKLQVKIIRKFVDDLPQQLAAAKIFISAFGISFYEALALKTLPICWPDSAAHAEDARIFYDFYKLKPLLIESSADLERLILPHLSTTPDSLPCCVDGTQKIVEKLVATVHNRKKHNA